MFRQGDSLANGAVAPKLRHTSATMITRASDPFDGLFNLQRALDAHLSSDWLRHTTTSRGPLPPINVFQQGDDILAISSCPASTRSTCKSRARTTPFGFRERRRPTTSRVRACIGGSVSVQHWPLLKEFSALHPDRTKQDRRGDERRRSLAGASKSGASQAANDSDQVNR
jgi:hypothetical protein